SASDLLFGMNALYDKEHLRFLFDKTEGVLIEALKENKPIVLTGKFSHDLKDHLSQFLWERSASGVKRPVITVISDDLRNTFAFPGLEIGSYAATAEAKRRLLVDFPVDPAKQALFEKYTFSQLQAMYAMKKYDETPWEGLESLKAATLS